MLILRKNRENFCEITIAKTFVHMLYWYKRGWYNGNKV